MEKIDQNAKVIWDYMHLNQKLKKSDAILVLGSNDLQTAQMGSDLYFLKYAPIIIFSGDSGETKFFPKPEAEIFRDSALERGVPASAIYVENKSKNTGQNIEFTKKLVEEKKLFIKSVILVQKPYMERRAYATFKKVWPEVDVCITSQPISYEDYISKTECHSREGVINRMIGDFQRIIEYPKKGFQIEQPVTSEALKAFDYLVSAGFDKELIKN